MVILTGCSTVEGYLQDAMLANSEIMENEEYQQYQKLKAEGKLDENAQYVADNTEISENGVQQSNQQQGKIQVSFAENKFLKMAYYKDKEMTQELNPLACYLNPGDFIYAELENNMNPNSNLYNLAEYRVYLYDKDGEHQKIERQAYSEAGLVYQIPNDYQGTQLSIFPVGAYPNRSIAVSVYTINEEGKREKLRNAGEWTIVEDEDERKYDSDTDEIQINPVLAYTPKFTFNENYFYVNSVPKCHILNPNEGYLVFYSKEPTDQQPTYEVELRKYLSLKIKCDYNAKITINRRKEEEPEVEDRSGKRYVGRFLAQNISQAWEQLLGKYERMIDKLQFGDSIEIETEYCEILEGDYPFIAVRKSVEEKKTKYILTVKKEKMTNNAAELKKEDIEVAAGFYINLSPNCKYGTCTYYLDKEELKELTQVKVRKGQKLKIVYTLNDGYQFKNKGLFSSGIEENKIIEIEPSLDGKTIMADEYFEVIEKGK